MKIKRQSPQRLPRVSGFKSSKSSLGSQDARRALALNCSWDISARQFIGRLQNVAASVEVRAYGS